MDPREEEALATAAIDCPRCHQPAGSTCHASDGSELPTPPSDVTAHWARVIAYRDSQAPDGNTQA
jgi:hypothetical protein